MGEITYGLALSGGGTRGAAHVGVLKALEEGGLLPKAIAGTSAGGIVAGLYASGMDIGSMERLVRLLEKEGKSYLDPDYTALAEFVPRLLTGMPVTLKGLIRGNRLQEYFCLLTGRRHLDQGELPFVIPAVDLNSGDTIAFTNVESIQPVEHLRPEWDAYLCEAMMASASVPAVFAPRVMGDYLLVDGGVTDNLPADMLRACGISNILAVDLGGPYEKPEDHSVFEVISHSFSIMSRRLKECGSETENFLLNPPLSPRAGLLSFDTMVDSMERAYEYTKEMLPKVRRWLVGEGV